MDKEMKNFAKRKKKPNTNNGEITMEERSKELRTIMIAAGIIFGILVVGSIIGSLVKTGELQRVISESKIIYDSMGIGK